MNPGEHLIVIGSEIDAFQFRALGLSLRDTVIILMPGVRVLSAFLFRAPLEGTVAENVLKHGVGALNIDGCRVGVETRSYKGSGAQPHKLRNHGPGDTGVGLMDGRGKDLEFSVRGRWPTNLLLVHGPGCTRVDGLETVDVWECVDGCPVKALDEMGGERPSCKNTGPTHGGKIFGKGKSIVQHEHGALYAGDTGYASRFFPCFSDLRGALDWLQRLVS